MIDDWVEGETAPRDYILKNGGVPFNLTGLTVTLELFQRDGTPIDTSGDVALVDAPAGRVRYTPDAGDLVPAVGEPYVETTVSEEIGDFAYFVRRARFKVSDALGGFGYFPKGDPDLWRVHKVQG